MSEITNQLGVTATAHQALQIGWFFRSQEVSDQGIDAHVEKVTLTRSPSEQDNEVGTGRLIAIQIKTGPSYFDEPSPNGWWFRFDAKKHNLWLGHALPVILVLVDLVASQIYWQRISSGTVTSTGKGFKVEVPRAQIMSTADIEWTHIASGLEDRALIRFDTSIRQLPPTVAELLSDRSSSEHPDAALLAAHLAEGRNNPRGTVESLLGTSPLWITRHPAWPWQAIGSYAAEHEQFDLSSEAFERAASAPSPGRGVLLAAAGLNAMHDDSDRSVKLLSAADVFPNAQMLVAVGRALLEHPANDAGPRKIPPIVAHDTDQVRSSGPVQGFLADQALRAGDVAAAEYHSSLQLAAEPQSSSAMIQRADILMRRSNSTSTDPEDMPTAIDLLTRARQQRKSWAGPIRSITIALTQALITVGEFDKVLDLTLREPAASETFDEAIDPHVRRYTIIAAYFSDQPHLVDHLLAELGTSTADLLLKVRIGLLELSDSEQIDLHRAALDEARASEEYHEIATAIVALAALGDDHSDVLSELSDCSIVPSDMIELVDALLIAHGDLDTALPSLRALARTDVVAYEHLNASLREAKRYNEAADNARTLYDATGNPHFLIQQAQNLIDANSSEAEDVAQTAANSTSVQPSERARLHLFLAVAAGNRGDWHVAERTLVTALSVGGPSHAAVWRIVVAQLNQGKLNHAAATIAKYRPQIRNLQEARLWLEAHATVRWNEPTASQALTLADRFNDPALSSELARAVLFATRTSTSPDPAQIEDIAAGENYLRRRSAALTEVAAELHGRAFAILTSLNDQGVTTGLIQHQTSPDQPDQLPPGLVSQLQQREAAYTTLDDVLKSVNASQLPMGALTGLLDRSYASVLIQRLLGALVSASANDEEHALDVQEATQALGTTVVVDAAALLTVSGMRNGKELAGQFLELTLAANSMRDIHRASAETRQLASSAGTLGWSRETSSPSFTPLSDEEFVRMHDRAEKLEVFAERSPGRVVPVRGLFPEISDAPAHYPWSDAVQLAHDRGVSLWTDDLGLRRYAREHAVRCFGTSAVIDAVRDLAIAQSPTAAAAEAAALKATSDNLQLAEDLVVDMPLSRADLIQLAANDLWRAHSGAAAICRPAWWRWTDTPFEDLRALYAKVVEAAPSELGFWQSAAMNGAASAYEDPSAATTALAALALSGFGPDASVDEIKQGIKRARIAAKANNLEDPLDHLGTAAELLRSEHLANVDADVAEVVDYFRHFDE